MRFFRVLSIEYVTDTVSLHSPRLHPPPQPSFDAPRPRPRSLRLTPMESIPRRRHRRHRIRPVDAITDRASPPSTPRDDREIHSRSFAARARANVRSRARDRAHSRRAAASRCDARIRAHLLASSRVARRGRGRARARPRAIEIDEPFVGALGCGRAFQTRLCAVVASRAGLARAGDKTQISRLVI